ncbi:MAG TPA: hypothetical protein VK468_05170, partial [Pyrinomonadaceae bacterium]|nr:hypothetical protein [Pyrinomonadaceae bacterium]
MRRSILLTIIVAAFVLISTGTFQNDGASAQIRRSDDLKTRNEADKNDRDLAASIRRLTDPPTDGLKETNLAGGGILTDLGGGFQNVMLARLGDDNEPVSACVNSVEEASAFFGRDLEKGGPVARNDYGRESLAAIAARHGMSEQEFLFYSKLAGEAFQQQIAMSPESATITIVNGDAPAEGFNDASARVPEGGNAGVTLGAQRLNLFN